MSLTPEQLKEMASQLGCPAGENGISVANRMHESNFGMTKSTISALKINDDDKVLELGHGSGKHIVEILQQAKNIAYTGLEISALMKHEAEATNDPAATSFDLYDGEHMPFSAEIFDKAMTVNTIYFWKNPVALLTEVHRVLKRGGIFCIAFAQKEFMQMLPFTQYGFDLYDDVKLEELVEQSAFKLVRIERHVEQVRSQSDEMVERLYGVAVLGKQ